MNKTKKNVSFLSKVKNAPVFGEECFQYGAGVGAKKILKIKPIL